MHHAEDLGPVESEEDIGMPVERQELVGTDIDVGEDIAAPADNEYFHFVAVLEVHAEGLAPRVLQIVEGTHDLSGADMGGAVHGGL